MLVIALIAAGVVWAVTITYWLVNRKRKAPPAPPRDYDQLLARIGELEERLQRAQAQGERVATNASEERRALEDLRREAVQQTTTRGQRARLPRPVQDQFTALDRMLDGMLPIGGDAFGRMTQDLQRLLRDPNATWSVTTTTTTREAPTTRHAQVPQTPPTPPTPPRPPTPPATPRSRVREQSPTVPDRPVQGRSVYERLRDKWPTTTTSSDPEEPESSPGKRTNQT